MVSGAPAVLIVDDEQAICELLCEALGEQGYACQAVYNADEALSRLKESNFDIALLDIKMPGMSGLDLLIKISESYRNTAVLMTTAVTDAQTAAEAMQRGARDYILKPFSVEEIRERVGKVLREKTQREANVAKEQSMDEPLEN
jgi:two-component system nitrogen regulation response regulator GlnG